MATDVEESDTEEHERPAPPKRKCIKIINITDEYSQAVHESVAENSSSTDMNSETLTREALLYQQYQIDKQCYMGTVDNTINRVMETYILTPPSERIQLRLFHETEMEDRAVMMAIRNHGLVHSTEIAANSCVSSDQWLNDENPITLSNSLNDYHKLSPQPNDHNPISATSADILKTKTFQHFDDKLKYNWATDKIDDSDQQQDILERAVAEAIKIKGLSALSVDYG